MVVEVRDAVVVDDRLLAVDLDEPVAGAEAVLDDEQRLLPAVPELVQHETQAHRVDLPTPLARRQRRVGHAAHDVAFAGRALRGVGGLGDRHVVAERHEIDRVGEVVAVLIGDVELDALLAQRAQEVPRVGAAGVHVAVDEVAVVGIHHGNRVVRRRRQRIDRHRQHHAADLRLGSHLAGDARGAGGCHELVVHRLVQLLLGNTGLGDGDAAAHERSVQQRIDLVEGQPVLHATAEALEQRAGVALVEADEVAVRPPAVLLGETRGQMRVAMLMYPDNARLINDALRAIAPGNLPDVIELGRMGSMLATRQWLRGGGLVEGDRAVGIEEAGRQALVAAGLAADFEAQQPGLVDARQAAVPHVVGLAD